MQLLTRATFVRATSTSIVMMLLAQYFPNQQERLSMETSQKAITTSAASTTTATAVYHKPPTGVDYTTNDSVFGQILRGELPATVWEETTNVLVFQDIHPRAPTHALIIPKRFIESVFDLTADDIPLLEEMQSIAYQLLQTRHPNMRVVVDYENDPRKEVVDQKKSAQKKDYNLCFHVPPFNSVDHLHLHVLAPVSQMKWYHKYIKYNTNLGWSVSLDTVLQRLRAGESAVPSYRRKKSQPRRNLLPNKKNQPNHSSQTKQVFRRDGGSSITQSSSSSSSSSSSLNNGEQIILK
jgi:diadenosine tetraphosphate (Ap4A) HIT family hydrolase